MRVVHQIRSGEADRGRGQREGVGKERKEKNFVRRFLTGELPLYIVFKFRFRGRMWSGMDTCVSVVFCPGDRQIGGSEKSCDYEEQRFGGDEKIDKRTNTKRKKKRSENLKDLKSK